VQALLKEGTLEMTKALIGKFVDKVVATPDMIVVHFNFFPEFTMKLDIEKDCSAVPCLAHVGEQSSSLGCDFGGDGGS